MNRYHFKITNKIKKKKDLGSTFNGKYDVK